jgi:hypothetical protein
VDDLLYLSVLGVPENESLSGVYIVDGIPMYASTKLINGTYNLYRLLNYEIVELLSNWDSLGHIDTIVANKHFQVIEQSGRYENNIKVVRYKTDGARERTIKRPYSERKEINRFVNSKMKKLF